jgi:hypothetical protein
LYLLLDELKRALLDYVESIGKEFPRAGKRMKGSILDIEEDLANHFSGYVISQIEYYLNKIMKNEVIRSFASEELEFLLEIADERIKILEGADDQEILMQARKLAKILMLELRAGGLMERAVEIERELRKEIDDALIMIPFDNPDEKIVSKLKILSERTIELVREKDAISKETGPDDILYGPGKMAVAKEVIVLKIRNLNRACVNRKDVEEKDNAQALLKKTKEIICIKEKEQQWRDTKEECRKYFRAKEKYSEIMDMDIGSSPILGMIII